MGRGEKTRRNLKNILISTPQKGFPKEEVTIKGGIPWGPIIKPWTPKNWGGTFHTIVVKPQKPWGPLGDKEPRGKNFLNFGEEHTGDLGPFLKTREKEPPYWGRGNTPTEGGDFWERIFPKIFCAWGKKGFYIYRRPVSHKKVFSQGGTKNFWVVSLILLVKPQIIVKKEGSFLSPTERRTKQFLSLGGGKKKKFSAFIHKTTKECAEKVCAKK